MSSGHCNFCDMWHSASCGHPGRGILAMKDDELNLMKIESARLREEIGKAVRFLKEGEVYDKVARNNSLMILLAALK